LRESARRALPRAFRLLQEERDAGRGGAAPDAAPAPTMSALAAVLLAATAAVSKPSAAEALAASARAYPAQAAALADARRALGMPRRRATPSSRTRAPVLPVPGPASRARRPIWRAFPASRRSSTARGWESSALFRRRSRTTDR